MKATKCPAKEKKERARKAKKEGKRETKSKSQACCVTSKTKTMTDEFFFRRSFRNCNSCVYNCNDLLSYNSSPSSSHVSYIFNFNSIIVKLLFFVVFKQQDLF